jgi:hypothetical protein
LSGTANARSGCRTASWGSVGEVRLPRAALQDGREVAIREVQWAGGGQGHEPGRHRPARNAPQPGQRLYVGLWGQIVDFADEPVKYLLGHC